MPTDISAQMNELNVKLFNTPAPGYMRKHGDRNLKPAVESLEEAREKGFPMKPNVAVESKKKSLK
jgi:hypothetical protein